MNHYTHQIAAYLSGEQLEVLDRASEARGVKKSQLLRMALAAYIQDMGYEWPGRAE
jgi:predicted DNA-binding protein